MERPPPKRNARQRDPAQRRDDCGPDRYAPQLWGELALVTPVGVEGLWTTSALYADKLACLPPAQTAVDYCSTQTECSG